MKKIFITGSSVNRFLPRITKESMIHPLAISTENSELNVKTFANENKEKIIEETIEVINCVKAKQLKHIDDGTLYIDSICNN